MNKASPLYLLALSLCCACDEPRVLERAVVYNAGEPVFGSAGKAVDRTVVKPAINRVRKKSSAAPDGGDECTLNATEQSLLDAHNAARSQGRQCGDTWYNATTELQWDCTLAGIADDHNRDMADNHFFSHTGSDGLSVSDRATNAGYNWRTVGENIAAGYPNVDSVMQGWLDSPGHCANIMRPGYEDLGAALLIPDSSADYSTYWTADFGTKF